VFRALRHVDRQPFAEQHLQFPRQAQHGVTRHVGAGFRGVFQHRFHVTIVQRRDDRRDQHTGRHTRLRERVHGLQAPVRRGGARFQFRSKPVVE